MFGVVFIWILSLWLQYIADCKFCRCKISLASPRREYGQVLSRLKRKIRVYTKALHHVLASRMTLRMQRPRLINYSLVSRRPFK